MNLYWRTWPIALNEEDARWIDVVDSGVRQPVARANDERLAAGGFEDREHPASVTRDAADDHL